MNFMEYWDGSLAAAIILSGLVIVFAALVILIGIVSVTGRLINKEAFAPKPPQTPSSPNPPASAPPAAPKGPSVAPIVQQGIGQETVAVISAAVAAMMDEQAPGMGYSVNSIQQSAGAGTIAARVPRPVWGFAGMQQNTRPF